MKVLSLIQVMETPKYIMELSTTINKEFIWMNGIDFDELRTFYNQPFKPELITKLFKFWKNNNELFYIPNSTHNIEFDEESKTYEIVNVPLDITFIYPIPRTLDDFITDCQRAGIELTWKERR